MVSETKFEIFDEHDLIRVEPYEIITHGGL